MQAEFSIACYSQDLRKETGFLGTPLRKFGFWGKKGAIRPFFGQAFPVAGFKSTGSVKANFYAFADSRRA